MTHDNTSAVMKKFKSIGARRIHDTRQPVFALDHDIQNREDSNLAKYRAIEAFAKQHGVDFYPAGSGIGHQIMVERGYVVPGSFVVASDSHSNMYGALGAVGTPVVRTDAAAGARPVLDHERLTEAFRQPLRDQPCDDVIAARRRKADDQSHRSRRIGLRASKARDGRQPGSACGQMEKPTARSWPPTGG